MPQITAELMIQNQYKAAACATDDIIRASAIRLKAESDLMRHERYGPPLAETCRSIVSTG